MPMVLVLIQEGIFMKYRRVTALTAILVSAVVSVCACAWTAGDDANVCTKVSEQEKNES